VIRDFLVWNGRVASPVRANERPAGNAARGGATLNQPRRGVRAAEGARLEIAYVPKGASRVQIPPSPLFSGDVAGSNLEHPRLLLADGLAIYCHHALAAAGPPLEERRSP
jgi:hypothetical protein